MDLFADSISVVQASYVDLNTGLFGGYPRPSGMLSTS